MHNIPKISVAEIGENNSLLITFDNGIKKFYPSELIFKRSEFSILENSPMFKCLSIEPGGYAISWSDDLDISENELWLNGVAV